MQNTCRIFDAMHEPQIYQSQQANAMPKNNFRNISEIEFFD